METRRELRRWQGGGRAPALVAACALVGLGLGGGCFLVSSDVASLRLDLPAKEFQLDAALFGVEPDPDGNVPAVSCASDDACCATPPCAPLRCGGGGVCEAHVSAALVNQVNLLQEAPEFSQLENQPVLEVRIVRFSYAITDGPLSFDTPPIDLLVAPEGVTDPDNPAARLFARIPTIPAGTSAASGAIALDDQGQQALSEAVGDYRVPFNVIARAGLDFPGGAPAPMGRLSIELSGTAEIDF